MRKTLIFLFLALFGWLTGLKAQESLSLADALSMALVQNFDIRIAQNNAAVAKNNKSIGEAGFLPNVQVTIDQAGSVNNIQQEFINGNQLTNPNASQESFNANVQLNWTIFDGMAMFTNYRRLGEFEKIGHLQAEAMVEQVIADLTMTYFEVVQRSQERALAEKSMRISEDRLKLAEERFNLGSSSRMEVLQARVDLNADRSYYLQQLELQKLSKVALNRLLGRDPALDFNPTDSIVGVEDLDYTELRTQALADNRWIAIAGLNRQVAELNRRQAVSPALPRIDLLGGYHFNRLQSEAGFLASNQNRGIDFGLRASINVFDGFRVQRQRQNTRIQLMSAELEFEKQQQAILAGITSTYTAFQNNKALVEMEQENLTIAAQTLEIAQQSYKLGAITPLELREVQRQYVAAESRLIQARFLFVVNRTELLRLSGRLLQ